MNYISTRKNNEKVSFKEAVINGLSNNGGLYFPEIIPQLPISFFDKIENLEDNEIAFKVLYPFIKGSLTAVQLKALITETINFPIPVVSVEKDIFALELFHGPTQAFKDVGARFMSRCLSHFYADKKEAITILVATSGDTGSAVANGFFNLPGVSVKILFPKGKVSPYQEYQMTGLGKNIKAIEVDGTFDDCQKLVKEAFNDNQLRKEISLSSANSINIARLLPQMLYYFFAYKQLKLKLKDKDLVVSVPSGNLGNLTAGLLAKNMGLPIKRFIAAHNANDSFNQYLKTGRLKKKASILTYSNAMDVGNPSNFERIEHLYKRVVNSVNQDVSSFSFNDDMTIEEIKNCYNQNNYMLDPHGAIGKLALNKGIKVNEVGVFIETAHPQKFSEIIIKAIPNYCSDDVDLKNLKKIKMNNSYSELKGLLSP
ncbi:MAG: threonine synthase [Flavobacteriales bacterium]|nr:MAG: threonine synthase [Flavobacteriales bacterium]